jgi:hypothetical protein
MPAAIHGTAQVLVFHRAVSGGVHPAHPRLLAPERLPFRQRLEGGTSFVRITRRASIAPTTRPRHRRRPDRVKPDALTIRAAEAGTIRDGSYDAKEECWNEQLACSMTPPGGSPL